MGSVGAISAPNMRQYSSRACTPTRSSASQARSPTISVVRTTPTVARTAMRALRLARSPRSMCSAPAKSRKPSMPLQHRLVEVDLPHQPRRPLLDGGHEQADADDGERERQRQRHDADARRQANEAVVQVGEQGRQGDQGGGQVEEADAFARRPLRGGGPQDGGNRWCHGRECSSRMAESCRRRVRRSLTRRRTGATPTLACASGCDLTAGTGTVQKGRVSGNRLCYGCDWERPWTPVRLLDTAGTDGLLFAPNRRPAFDRGIGHGYQKPNRIVNARGNGPRRLSGALPSKATPLIAGSDAVHRLLVCAGLARAGGTCRAAGTTPAG